MKIVVATDSYKGTLSAPEVCSIIATEVRRALPQADVEEIPVADGGEGTVDAMVAALGGKHVLCSVTGPLGRP
ncbi:MAG: glycerate kinase [Planctomycetia bacterium]|nr:glycerate kinase [Planctomycetia bacterium]